MTKPLTRRAFLADAARVAGGAALGGGIVACWSDRILDPQQFGRGASSMERVSAAVNDLLDPPLLAAPSGVLSASIGIGTTPVKIGDRVLLQPVTYADSLPGPTLWVRQGQWLDLQFTNRIVFDQAGPRGRYRPPRDAAATNVHYHGLHVSPSTTSQGTADDMSVMIPRNGSQRYFFQIPHTHPAGLFFYHPHVHGVLTSQMGRGAAGMLYVAGAQDDEVRRRGIRHRLMMLQQAFVDTDDRTLTFDDGAREDAAHALSLINGQLQPNIRIRPGEPQVWSVCNGSTSAFYVLRLDGHEFEVIANDGLPLPASSAQNTVAVAPGKRTEFVVRGSNVPGRYAFRLDELNQGVDSWPAKILGTLVVDGPAWTGQDHPGVDRSTTFPDLRGLAIAARRTITFDVNENVAEGEYGRFTMNGHPWGTNTAGQPDPEFVEWTSHIGQVEEWVIENHTNQDHPFHVHTNPIQVVNVTGSPVQAQLGYQDTVVVPRNGGTVTVRTRFDDFSGRILMHCHIIDHEDMGMMTSFRIAD